MNLTAYLKAIRILHYILLLCAALLIVLGYMIAGIIALALGLFVVWKFHRCPKCGSEIDTRLSLEEIGFCPICGHDLKDGQGH